MHGCGAETESALQEMGATPRFLLYFHTSAFEINFYHLSVLVKEIFSSNHQGQAMNICISRPGHHWFRTSDDSLPLSRARCQAMTLANADILSVRHQEQTSVKFESKHKNLWRKSMPSCQLAAILSQSQYIKISLYLQVKPLLHIGGFCRRSAAVQKPWIDAVERHKAQTQPWVNAAERHWAPIPTVAVRKFWNVQNFRRQAPVKYLSVMECHRAPSIVLDCR